MKKIILLVLSVNITTILFAQHIAQKPQVSLQSNQNVVVSRQSAMSLEQLSDKLYTYVKEAEQTQFNTLYSKWIKDVIQNKDSLRLSFEQLKKNRSILIYRQTQKGKLNKGEQIQLNEWSQAVIDSLEDSVLITNNNLEKENHLLRDSITHMKILMEPDVDIFVRIWDFNIESIPICLRPHAELIKRISELKDQLDRTDERISNIKRATTIDTKETVRKNIADDVNGKLSDSFYEIYQRDTSSLSVRQREYFENLKGRYNNYLSEYF